VDWYDESGPELYDYVRFGRSEGLVGEEKTINMAILTAISKTPYVIEAPSGSGKTTVIRTVFKTFPDNYVYETSAGSAKNDIYDEDMRDVKHIFIPELQKAALSGDFTIDMLKSWGEGMDYNWRVTVRSNDGFFKTQKIRLPARPFTSTFAIENKNSVFDIELRRRCIIDSTDVSKECNKNVVKRNAKSRMCPSNPDKMSYEEFMFLKQHMTRVLSGASKLKTYNPLAEYISDKFDTTFIISRTLSDYFFRMVDAITKFYFVGGGRTTIDGGGILSTPQDNWIAWEIYWDTFKEQCLMLPPLGTRILKIVSKLLNEREADEFGNPYSITDSNIQSELRKIGYTLNKTTIDSMLKQLIEAGYLRYDGSTKKKGARYVSGDVPLPDTQISWPEAYQKAIEISKELYPNKHEEYIKSCSKIIVSPITGEAIKPFERSVRETIEAPGTFEDFNKKLDEKRQKREKQIELENSIYTEIKREMVEYIKNNRDMGRKEVVSLFYTKWYSKFNFLLKIDIERIWRDLHRDGIV